MIRSICLAVAAIHCSMAFAPPQLPPSHFVRHADCMVPFLKGTRSLGSDDAPGFIGSSSVLSRVRSRNSAMHAAIDSSNAESVESFPEYTNNSDEESDLMVTVAGGGGGVGGFDPEEKLGLERETANVGDPQTAQLEPMNITKVLTELQAIQSQGPKKYCILGTRHCSFLHQQIVEMLAYALVLSGNHLYTSGAAGTNAAAIRGALRAFQPQLLTVVLPQSMSRQTPESQELLQDVTNVVTMPQNDEMPLDVASRICNSHLLSQTDHLISFAFHESKTVLEAAQEAKKLDMLVTLLYLD
mmetsp:Transcript_52396/g.111326  ORF Transcript_52396/g.111326 Transcript_52396/m.111326 type:complete len:299 (-) Transcript_52396:279-1175(-)